MARNLDLDDQMMLDGGIDDGKRPRHDLQGVDVRLGKYAAQAVEMQEHFNTIDVELDDGRQQLYSCVANGKLYRESEIEILAAVLKGTDITEVYSPERVTKLFREYGLTPGDSFDLRDGYDLSDERTQALVISRIKKSQPSMVVGSPPCTMFSRLQQLNLHVHGDSWKAQI